MPAGRARGRRRLGLLLAVAGGLAGALASTAAATHSWGGYHWARSASPFTLPLLDSVTSRWDPSLSRTSADWSASSVLDTVIAEGGTDTRTRRRCPMVTGKVRICNDAYGYNGWLGLASVRVSGDHIVQATTKLNDSYFDLPTYDSAVWRNHVTCQEVGHTLGLDHQDESGASLRTCMDYSTDPTASQSPNAHDYEQLELIYAYLDGEEPSSGPGKGRRGGATGLRRVRDDLWVEDLGGGARVFHFVYWAAPGRHGPPDLG